MNTYDNYYTQASDYDKARFRAWVRSMLLTDEVQVTFKKKDGTLRVMNCTLREDVAIPYEKKTDRVKEPNKEVCPVWDIDKHEWRSFRFEAITEIHFSIDSDADDVPFDKVVSASDEKGDLQ